MCRRSCVLILAFAPALTAADKPNPEMVELQRQVAQLQERVQMLQRSLEERISTMGGQVQGAAEAARQAGAAVGAVQSAVEKAAQDQARAVTTQVATLGTRIDQVAPALRTVQEAVSELAGVVSKLQTQIHDLTDAVNVLKQPPKAPVTEGPSLPATELMARAEGDRRGGKFELALQEYIEFLKWYGDAPAAATAQYYLGWIHYSLQDYSAALDDFQGFIEKYESSEKLPWVLDYKAKCLKALGRPAEEAEAYKELRKRFPAHDLAKQAPRAGK